jgi:hypothetical protein
MSRGILHVSDLHRSPAEPIDNDELISSLVADRDLYRGEEPPVPVPEAVVVSGDLVQGATPGSADPDAEVREQYEVALDFLSRLADRFAAGDRSRVVVVPGNHDVAWPVARAAMVPVDPSTIPLDIGPAAFGPLSDLRWDWRERALHRIVDRSLYEQRFRRYTEAVDAFYADIALPFICEPDSYFRLFELFDSRVGVAAFNSCDGNDCYSFHGHIPQRAVARAHMGLHDRVAGYDLLMAVWHHSVEGAPYASDYMDVDVVHALIGKGFRLGLHGHQHRAEASTRYIHLPGQVPMALVSAGSLCAGQGDLPRGVNRQYNVVEIDDDFATVRVHVREMTVSTVFAPAMRAEFGGRSFIDLNLSVDPTRALATRVARVGAAVADAEHAAAAGRFVEAAARLASLRPAAGSYPRALLVKTVRDGQLWEQATDLIGQPADADELALLVQAYAETDRHDEALGLLASAERAGMPGPTAADLRRWVEAKREMDR